MTGLVPGGPGLSLGAGLGGDADVRRDGMRPRSANARPGASERDRSG